MKSSIIILHVNVSNGCSGLNDIFLLLSALNHLNYDLVCAPLSHTKGL